MSRGGTHARVVLKCFVSIAFCLLLLSSCPVEALKSEGLQILPGMDVMEHARLIKGPDEVLAMRCALATCEIAVAEMEKALQPGISENRLWSILHAENIARGGEWIETRILNSGP